MGVGGFQPSRDASEWNWLAFPGLQCPSVTWLGETKDGFRLKNIGEELKKGRNGRSNQSLITAINLLK
jgi:hypothetical protein